jgi:hypothetical protein
MRLEEVNCILVYFPFRPVGDPEFLGLGGRDTREVG